MKNKILIMLSTVFIITQLSCSGFLDREPLDQLTEENFYQNLDQASLGMLAAYAPMQSVDWYGKSWMITEVPSDNSQPGGTDPDFTPIDKFSVNADNTPVNDFWKMHYQLITYANSAMQKINKMEEVTEDEIAPLLAEGRCLRAFAYFDLVRIFGSVPLITAPPSLDDDLNFARSTEDEVYELIKSDLLFAIEHLPENRTGLEIGRISKGAALAILSKVHLTLREWNDARDRAREVIAMGKYDLLPDYGDLWRLETSDNNQETIFQVQYSGCGPFGTGNAMQAFFAPWGEGITKDRDGWGSHIPTGGATNNPGSTIQDAFETNDTRKYWTLMSPGNHYDEINPEDGGYTYPSGGASASSANIRKYVVGGGQNVCFMSTPQNAHVIRYSDVLLTLAESIMEVQGGQTINDEALDALNQVRARAGLEPAENVQRDALYNERRVEFAFEGHRWFDLLRSGDIIDIMLIHGTNIQPHNLLFPIPSTELAVNPKLTQNPGY